MTLYILFFFNDTATTEIYTLSLHDALPIAGDEPCPLRQHGSLAARWLGTLHGAAADLDIGPSLPERGPSPYLEHLRSARTIIVEGFGHLALLAVDSENGRASCRERV